MATEVHCLYCFETLAARLEKRHALSLQEVESSWRRYCHTNRQEELLPDDGQELDLQQNAKRANNAQQQEDNEIQHQHNLRPRQPSKLQGASPVNSSNASTPSNSSSNTLASQTSSSSSLTSSILPSTVQKEPEFPLFVTWNTINSRQQSMLRGCIGTFENQPLSQGLREYALTSALHDVRFSPISLSELSRLECDVTLLTDFAPCRDALDWEVGVHGIRLSFMHQNRRYSSTYLPQIAPEQGWTKEETIISLMRKAGWSGRSSEWKKVTNLQCIKYEGKKAEMDFETFKSWRDWVVTETNEV